MRPASSLPYRICGSVGGGDVIARPALSPFNFYVTEQWTVKRLMSIQTDLSVERLKTIK
jgi:hypothetical protein